MARRPYTGRTTSPFGRRLAPIPGASTMHLGVDGIGGYNVAPEGGGLVGYGYAGGWGNRIAFAGDSGTLHYLAHNAPNGLLVPVGKWYPEGTALGIKGMTGTATGVHVHWETRPGGGAPIDPEQWLRNQAAPAGGGGTPITESDENMVLIRDENGSFFLVGEFYAAAFGAPDIVGRTAAAEVFGSNVQVTNASAQRAITSANERRASLIGEVVNAVIAKLPKTSGGTSAPIDSATIDAIAKAAAKATVVELKLPGN